MNENVLEMPAYIRELGSNILGQALEHATCAEMGNPHFHAIATVQAAHGVELILKARIAEEHPLLIFTSLPKAPQEQNRLLGIEDLLEQGKTVGYFELPDLLWQSAGYRVPDLQRYIAFGKLRNKIQHLARPQGISLSDEVLRYVFLIAEPMINDFWRDTCIHYIGRLGEETHLYLKEQIDELQLPYAGEWPD